MEHADYQRKDHGLVVGRLAKLTHNHALFQPLRQVQFHQFYTKEGTNQCAYDRSGSTQRDQQIHHTSHRLGHLRLQIKAQDNQQQAITCITHTQTKEECIEGSQQRCRVELAIIRHTIHLGQHLKETGHGIVLQFDRCIVLLLSRTNLIIDTT